MKAYQEYKDSGIEWLDKIPSSWNEIAIKHLASLKSGENITSEEIEENGQYAVYGGNGVRGFFSEYTHDGNFVLIGRQGALCGNINYAKGKFWATEHAVVATPKREYKLVWFGELLRTMNLNQYSMSAAQPGLSVERIENLKIPVPPLPEQQAIADFLDRKTAQIDTLIAKKQRQIELLHEQRTALINHAVTKGLNPNIKMKDSGVEWLGEIPSHWDVKRIKHLVQRKKNAIKTGPFGSQLTNADMMGADVKVYNQRSVIDNDFVNGDNYVSLEKYEQLKEFEIFSGDILITTRGTIGRCAIFSETAEKGILHPCLIRLQLDEQLILKEYLIWFIQDSVLFKQSIFFESNATTIDVIYSGTMKQVIVPVPPVKEQAEIIKFLVDVESKVQQANEKLEKEISFLQEYRTALISEAVTGKIDVRTAE
ncbi:MAG: restriction endonuclease subunit S [Anaerolineales bacterium]|nr:restriction endonuclease subunit S [Anaerolineales bacterium]